MTEPVQIPSPPLLACDATLKRSSVAAAVDVDIAGVLG